MNKFGIGIGIGALLLIVLVAIGMSGAGMKEVVVKEIDVKKLPNDGMFDSKDVLVDIPDDATNVRVVYSLVGDPDYGMGSNGNMGITMSNIAEGSGESPIMDSYDNKYLEAGAGKTITGEFTSNSNGAFYLEGNYISGTITIYATVPV